jgi:carotenoid cleavage dioxygenase-like enzyme
MSSLSKKDSAPFQTLIKVDNEQNRFDEFQLSTEEFAGEPAFALKQGNHSIVIMILCP